MVSGGTLFLKPCTFTRKKTVFPRKVWDQLRSFAGEVIIETRGWDWQVLQHKYKVRPSISDVTSPCATKRDVYFRKVLGMKMENKVMEMGRKVHEAFMAPFKGKKFETEDEILKAAYEEGMRRYLNSKEEGIPIAIEPEIPGSAIGLSDVLKPDFIVGLIPTEVVYGSDIKRKELALTGYALALEAWTGHPVNYGVVIAINGRISWKVVIITEGLRRRFLELRDYVARMLSDREDPDVAESCPKTCPFYGVCHEGAGNN